MRHKCLIGQDDLLPKVKLKRKRKPVKPRHCPKHLYKKLKAKGKI